MFQKSDLAVIAWNNAQAFFQFPDGDWKDGAAAEDGRLRDLWHEFVSESRGPAFPDGYLCPREFLSAQEEVAAATATIRHRFYRYLAGLSLEEFDEVVEALRERAEAIQARIKAFWADEDGEEPALEDGPDFGETDWGQCVVEEFRELPDLDYNSGMSLGQLLAQSTSQAASA